MRQVKIAMGKESQRVQLVWIITDGQSVDPEIDAAYDKQKAGFMKIRLPKDLKKREELLSWLNRDGLADSIHLLEVISKKKNLPLSKGLLDTRKAATMLINDYRNNLLGRITLESPESRDLMMKENK